MKTQELIQEYSKIQNAIANAIIAVIYKEGVIANHPAQSEDNMFTVVDLNWGIDKLHNLFRVTYWIEGAKPEIKNEGLYNEYLEEFVDKQHTYIPLDNPLFNAEFKRFYDGE